VIQYILKLNLKKQTYGMDFEALSAYFHAKNPNSYYQSVEDRIKTTHYFQVVNVLIVLAMLFYIRSKRIFKCKKCKAVIRPISQENHPPL